jgi:trans-aconitate 2-methyltransferase
MLAAARERLPGVRFLEADIARWPGRERFDVLFANASLQWLPDHAALFPALLERLAPGGTLAVQMPDNLDEPTHRLMRETAAEGPWATRLAGAAAARADRHPPDWYWSLLRPISRRLEIWRTTYLHPLAGPDGIVAWLGATGLRPFLAPLAEAEAAAFLGRYRAAVASAYPAHPDGTILLPFPRLFLLATR